VPKPRATPYPPDPSDDAPKDVEFGNLVDVVAVDKDWHGLRALRFAARRVELRRSAMSSSTSVASTSQDSGTRNSSASSFVTAE